MGDLIGDRYRLADRIAAGGMGEVWRAVDATLNRTVAVKMLHTRFIEEASAGERFRREARAMAALRHPNVAEVYDYGEAPLPGTSGLAYIVMAYVQGQPLSERIAELGRLGTAETLSIVAQTARALQAAHDVGVVHRDVKPGNLIIEPDGHVVLVDFGIAHSPEATSLTAANQVVGTALYMAPEQLSRNAITPAADIYALGAVAYHCLAGHPPFPGENPVAVALRRLDEEPPPLPDHVPAAVRDLVATAMAKDPDHRFPTAAAMADTAEAASGSPASPTAPALAAVAPAAPEPAGAATRSPEAARRPGQGAGARRGITVAALALLATAAAAAVLADRTGWSPGPSDVPSPSAVTPKPDSGGGDPGNAPSGVRSARPDPDLTTTPAVRGSEPASGPSSAGPGATPSATVRTSAAPTATTVEPTPEPTGDTDTGSPTASPPAPTP
ncbi:protein kinase domain-containing protein [Micromonospora thermarum]|uniref:protein kinase domain-containing protein n=1 Tax=Micromonospora thermarum TaxID=2720024 RepID=UPI0040390730